MESRAKRTQKTPKEPYRGAPQKKAKPRVPRKRIYISSSDDEEYEVLTAPVQVKQSAPPVKRASPPTVGQGSVEDAPPSTTFPSLVTVTGTPTETDCNRLQHASASRSTDRTVKLSPETDDVLSTEIGRASPQAVKGIRTPQEAVAYYDHDFRDNVEDEYFVPMQRNPLAGEMDVGMVDGFIRYVLAMHTRSVLYVSLNYSVYVGLNGLDNVIKSGLEEHVVAGDRSTFDLAVIPIRLAHGHYVLAIYEVHTGLVRYYDPLPRPMDLGLHHDSILRMATYLHDTYRTAAHPPQFMVQDPASYSHQADDFSCGFFVSLYVELYLHRGAAGMLLQDDAFLPDYRRRVVRIMSDLYNGNFPDYGELPGAGNVRPQRAAAAKAIERSAEQARDDDDSSSEQGDSDSDASINHGSSSSSDSENESPPSTGSTASVRHQPTPEDVPQSGSSSGISSAFGKQRQLEPSGVTFEEPSDVEQAVNARTKISIIRVSPPSKKQFDASSHKRTKQAMGPPPKYADASEDDNECPFERVGEVPASPQVDSARPSREALIAQRAVTYNGHTYHSAANKRQRWVHWRCWRYKLLGCQATFKYDESNDNFVEVRATHDHSAAQHLRKPEDTTNFRCGICLYKFKSPADKNEHFTATDHGRFEFHCDFPGCKMAWRGEITKTRHMKKHYGDNNGQNEHIDNYNGPGVSNPVLGLKAGNKCPECDKLIICLSHYVWHMVNDHHLHCMTVLLTPHLRCVACSACIPFASAIKHFDIYCPLTIVPELRQVFNVSATDRKFSICNCQRQSMVPHHYPSPLKFWSDTTTSITAPRVTRNLSSVAKEFFLRQKTKSQGNNVYAVVEVDVKKRYTLFEFVGSIRYIGSCHALHKRYNSSGTRMVPPLENNSPNRLYVVRLCAVIDGMFVHSFDDGDMIFVETFTLLHIGLCNLFNIRYPMSAQNAVMDADFRRLTPASTDIVKTLLEGTYIKVVKAHNWRLPDAMLYDSFIRTLEKFGAESFSHIHASASSTGSSSVLPMPSPHALARTLPYVYAYGPSPRASNVSVLPSVSAAHLRPSNSQECADDFVVMLELLSASEGIPVEEAFGRVLKKSNFQDLMLRAELKTTHKHVDQSTDELSTNSMDPGNSFGPDDSAFAEDSPSTSTFSSNC